VNPQFFEFRSKDMYQDWHGVFISEGEDRLVIRMSLGQSRARTVGADFQTEKTCGDTAGELGRDLVGITDIHDQIAEDGAIGSPQSHRHQI
jgi:hypothetical protein